MPPDHAGAVGDASLGRAQQQSRGIDRAGGEHDELGGGDAAFRRRPDIRRLRPARRRATSAGARRARRFAASRSRCASALARPQVSASILPLRASGKASQGVAARFSQASTSTPSGSDSGVQADARHALPRRGDRRFVRHGRERIGRGMPRLGRILAQRAAHLVERLGARIPGLQLVVVERPARRRSLGVSDGAEILRAIAEQHGAIELASCRRRNNSCPD